MAPNQAGLGWARLGLVGVGWARLGWAGVGWAHCFQGLIALVHCCLGDPWAGVGLVLILKTAKHLW
ncbi:hypothetical protein V8C86DRAFT_2630024, partial [Haematococcus lacustris]